MNKELEEQLYRSYPLLYRGRHLPKEESAMCWGICAGDGWLHLIDRLSGNIEREIERMKGDGCPESDLPKATQVKEKLGSLRFHVRPRTPVIQTYIEAARDESELICESCGRTLATPSADCYCQKGLQDDEGIS